MAELARILIYGDIHLSSKNYGAHKDYPRESLHYFREISRVMKERQATHLIGLGDFSYGRFNTLEYRLAVEKELIEQYNFVKGNRFELEGNHDSAGYGMTEYQYYIEKGYLRGSTNFKVGNVNISMIDYGKTKSTNILTPGVEGELNVVLAHDFLKFDDTQMPDYGKALRIEDLTHWYGVDYLICGHVHNKEAFEGLMVDGTNGHRMMVHYVGCLTRPSYREGHMDEIGNVVLLTVYDNGEMKYEVVDIPLWSLEDTFNLDAKAAQKEKKAEKEARVDISDIVSELAGHERNVGNPEDIIAAMQGVPDKYKEKAISLLKAGLA